MADANQLKIKARRREAAGDYEQAGRLYLRALSAMDEGGNLSDPSLLVRVADLEYRQDDEESALEYYLRAVDEYAEQGLITNAIAVCNKILRVFPDQVDCHRRLADLHMDVGLTAEARQNLLRFADEAWDPESPGRVLEAMRTFLDRTPDQEVALRLASHLQVIGREDEALDALESVWEERTRAGADVEALERRAEEIRPEARVEDWSTEEADREGADADGQGAGDDGAADIPGEAADAVDRAGDDADELPGAKPAAAGGSDPFDADGPDDPDAADTADEGALAGATEEDDVQAEDDPAADAEWAIGVTGTDRGASRRRPAASGADDEGRGESSSPARSVAAQFDDAGWGHEDARRGESHDRSGGGRPAFGNGRESRNGGTSDREDPSGPGPSGPDHSAGGGDRPSGLPGELELVASFRDRLTPFQPSGPAAEEPEPSGPAAEDPEPTDATVGPATDATAERGTEAATVFPSPEPSDEDETTERAADAEARDEPAQAQREEEIMEELNELDRVSDVATADSGEWDDDLPPRSDEPDPGGELRPGGSPAGSQEADEALGEKAELRRGLELVDEMLEVQPDNLDLRERKLRYARRLGEREALVEASLDYADALAKDGARRSARALYRRVLEIDPENQAAESGLARLDVGELEEKRQSGKRAGADHETPRAATPEEQEARRELGMRLWTEFENSIREMPWLHAATQAYQATDPEALPPLETFEMLAHYLMARERYADAAGILERALELADEADEDVADVLYYLGRAYEKQGRDERAAEYFERLEGVDPDFARVRGTLSEADGS